MREGGTEDWIGEPTMGDEGYVSSRADGDRWNSVD
jgi:hypothetical protein